MCKSFQVPLSGEYFVSLDMFGFPDYYVSQYGNVYSLKYRDYLLPYPDKDGYLSVQLYNQNESRHFRIHRLVASVFISNLENKPQVNHLDGNVCNNCVLNLEWTTAEENIHHAINLGLWSSNTLSEDIVHEICRHLQNGERNVDIDSFFNLDHGTTKDIRNGYRWTSISSMYNIPQVSSKETESEVQAHEVCRRLSIGDSPMDIVKEIGVSTKFVENIKSGNAWLSVSSQYNIPAKSNKQLESAELVRKICEYLQKGYRSCDIAIELGIRAAYVRKIKNRERWSEITKNYLF